MPRNGWRVAKPKENIARPPTVRRPHGPFFFIFGETSVHRAATGASGNEAAPIFDSMPFRDPLDQERPRSDGGLGSTGAGRSGPSWAGLLTRVETGWQARSMTAASRNNWRSESTS